jgi:hypothetical protein
LGFFRREDEDKNPFLFMSTLMSAMARMGSGSSIVRGKLEFFNYLRVLEIVVYTMIRLPFLYVEIP